jgi:hypothetical protein
VTWANWLPLLAFVIPAAAGIFAAYEYGRSQGLCRSREIEERIDGPVDWEAIQRAKQELNMKGWFV